MTAPIITPDDLRELGACDDHLRRFAERWPDGVALTHESLAEAHRLRLDVRWLAEMSRDSAALAVLATDDDAEVRRRAARNLATPTESLAALALDDDARVRRWIALKFDVSPEVLAILATDADRWVRRRVACNPSTPTQVLAALTMDVDFMVRQRATTNLARRGAA